ncbi:pyocin knob domain-containing protein [Lactobacillus amylolyticus]|uniref:pyocin knob domain-containing protein n=1 Tax=Lactobacillus amylolyticus TaxID=83683 RepID=UPI0024908D75|nr:pyocin knob domain-containing protein [Lactobacillus amylolyticus]
MVGDPKFNNTILTNIGHKMLTSLASGNKKITYTKAEAYSQDVSSIDNGTLQALTSLQGIELSTNLLVSNENGNVVTITANFENKGLTSDAVFNSVGWFAELDTSDTDNGITANQEYLIGITPANGAQTLVAPPTDQSSSQTISLNLNMTLSDAASVNMTVSDAGAVHFNQLDDQLANYTTTSDLTKLLAGKADLGLSYTKAELDAKLLNLTTDTSGKVSADQVQALISDKANISDVYTKSQIDSDLSTRDAQINAKANISDVYTKSEVDSDFSARDTQINTKANISDVYTKSDVDSALAADRGRLGKLEGTQTLDSPDFNTITATGVYYITNNNATNIKNNPSTQWGVLVVSNGNGNRTSQVYYPDDGSPQWCRLLNGSNWLPWYQLSTKNDVSNATNLANQAQTTADTKANSADVYTKSEVDSKVNVDGPLFKHLTQFNNWSDLFDGYIVDGFTITNGNRLVAFRDDTNGGNTAGSFSAGIGFGGGDTKGVLSVKYGDHIARIAGGNGTSPSWHEDIAWKSDVNDLSNQIQQLCENQFETQTFTDATAAANWEAQRPGLRLAIIQS